jgi:hypothetical protein
MDQISQKQKANRAKPRQATAKGRRWSREIPFHRDLFGVSDPGTSARRWQSPGRRGLGDLRPAGDGRSVPRSDHIR